MKMEGIKMNKKMLILMVAMAALIPSLSGYIVDFDEFWHRRARLAMNNNLDAYNPHPHHIINEVNQHVQKSRMLTEEEKESEYGKETTTLDSTRRSLGKYVGPCKATNPIDRCWRCDPNWINSRKKIVKCVIGFGRNTTGGRDGEYYVVTDNSDNVQNPKPGTLRHAVIQERPLWIIFGRSMKIRLSQELLVTSDKTIDGRGYVVEIANGASFMLQFIRNVIICNLRIYNIVPGNGGLIRDSANHMGLRTRSDGDGISIFGSSDIWIDHVTIRKCSDGIIDAIQGSTAITISNSHFTDHNDVMLFGGSDSYTPDQKMQITVAFNHFGKRLIQRMPRVRFGFVHVVNNDYTHWEMYAIGGSSKPTIISQGNRFVAPDSDRCKEVTKRDYATAEEWLKWTWRSEKDEFVNGAYFNQSGNPNWSKDPRYAANNLMPAAPGTEVSWMTKFAGILSCRRGRPC